MLRSRWRSTPATALAPGNKAEAPNSARRADRIDLRVRLLYAAGDKGGKRFERVMPEMPVTKSQQTPNEARAICRVTARP